MLMADRSFKRPGSIPFKWEIQPGVPKPHKSIIRRSSPPTPKLSHPPSMSSISPSFSLTSAASTSLFSETTCTVSQGCFPIHSLRRKYESRCFSSSPSSDHRFSVLLLPFSKSLKAKNLLQSVTSEASHSFKLWRRKVSQ